MKIQRCKGMRDMSPDVMALFHAVKGICRDCFTRWGYREVRTPTIEYLHLFTSAGTLTPGMLGKVYSFLDWDGWSGERVVLRPDGTIPVARMYTEYLADQKLARLFYVANMFSFEALPEKPRERWQCGAELIGAGSAKADAELIALSMDIVKKLGLKGAELRLSHAGLIRAILAKLKLSPEEQHNLFESILDGDGSLLAEISRKSTQTGDVLVPLLNLKGQSVDYLKSQRESLCREIPEIQLPLDDFLKAISMLEDLGIKYQINIASGAGFEYYTGIIFRLFLGKENIGGGGRYDDLIRSMGGGDVPASGFAVYLDQLMKLVKAGDVIMPPLKKILVKGSNIKEVFRAAEALRSAGYIVEFDLDGQKVDWALEVKGGGAMTLISKAKKTEVKSVEEVIKLLEAKGAA